MRRDIKDIGPPVRCNACGRTVGLYCIDFHRDMFHENQNVSYKPAKAPERGIYSQFCQSVGSGVVINLRDEKRSKDKEPRHSKTMIGVLSNLLRGPKTVQEICKNTGLSYWAVQSLLMRLRNEGVVKADPGIGGKRAATYEIDVDMDPDVVGDYYYQKCLDYRKKLCNDYL